MMLAVTAKMTVAELAKAAMEIACILSESHRESDSHFTLHLGEIHVGLYGEDHFAIECKREEGIHMVQADFVPAFAQGFSGINLEPGFRAVATDIQHDLAVFQAQNPSGTFAQHARRSDSAVFIQRIWGYLDFDREVALEQAIFQRDRNAVVTVKRRILKIQDLQVLTVARTEHCLRLLEFGIHRANISRHQRNRIRICVLRTRHQ